jgi:hypothetical protein
MSERYRLIGSGDVVALDDPRRDPRLVGNVSWAALPRDVVAPIPAGRCGDGRPWEGRAWGELVADCGCDDCRAQRAAAAN